MPLPTNIGPIPNDINGKLNRSIVPTQIDPNQPAMVVVNPDGSGIAGGSSSSITYSNFVVAPLSDRGVVSATSSDLFSLTYLNFDVATTYYFMIFNQSGLPINGASPIYTFIVPTTSQVVIGNDFFGLQGRELLNGIAFGVSTTPQTLTLGGAVNGKGNIHFQA